MTVGYDMFQPGGESNAAAVPDVVSLLEHPLVQGMLPLTWHMPFLHPCS